ncbi:hypothetical protein NQ317_006931 [Molorchus minor]|uniref:SUN domain-containing protein n=1 Tax=Molorchus minor TaxID=1323400 RepID=A0ABQ9JMT1_9CUCU|nr:hypothetical protein NQ317_006931 [Molorchus minor]
MCSSRCDKKTDVKLVELKSDVEKIGDGFENLAFDVMKQILSEINLYHVDGDYYISEESASDEEIDYLPKNKTKSISQNDRRSESTDDSSAMLRKLVSALKGPQNRWDDPDTEQSFFDRLDFDGPSAEEVRRRRFEQALEEMFNKPRPSRRDDLVNVDPRHINSADYYGRGSSSRLFSGASTMPLHRLLLLTVVITLQVTNFPTMKQAYHRTRTVSEAKIRLYLQHTLIQLWSKVSLMETECSHLLLNTVLEDAYPKGGYRPLPYAQRVNGQAYAQKRHGPYLKTQEPGYLYKPLLPSNYNYKPLPSFNFGNDLLQPKKYDLFTAIVLKILDKILAALPAVLNRLFGYGILQLTNFQNSYGNSNDNSYGGYNVASGDQYSIQSLFKGLDYASVYACGSIISTPDTIPYPANKSISFFNLLNVEVLSNPEMMLQPNNFPSNCFAFHGPTGKIRIKLGRKISVKAVTMDHIKFMEDISSAPKDFEIYVGTA